MQRDLHFDLFGREAAMLQGMLFVDEFYGDDGIGTTEGSCLADAVETC
jgi:hypothetical protein